MKGTLLGKGILRRLGRVEGEGLNLDLTGAEVRELNTPRIGGYRQCHIAGGEGDSARARPAAAMRLATSVLEDLRA